MICDFLGEWILHNAKDSIKDGARGGTPLSGLSAQGIHARIVMYSPELARELNARSSRDRIARGVFVNVPFIGIATFFYFVKNLPHSYLSLTAGLTLIFTVLLTLVVYLMWRRFQKNSYVYEVCAYQAVEDKLKLAGPSTTVA